MEIPEDGWHRHDQMRAEEDMAGQIERQRAEIERLRAALQEIIDRENLDHTNAAAIKIARGALTAAQ